MQPANAICGGCSLPFEKRPVSLDGKSRFFPECCFSEGFFFFFKFFFFFWYLANIQMTVFTSYFSRILMFSNPNCCISHFLIRVA